MLTKIYPFKPVETAKYTWQVPSLWVPLILQQLELASAPHSPIEVDDFIVATSDITPAWSKRMLGALNLYIQGFHRWK